MSALLVRAGGRGLLADEHNECRYGCAKGKGCPLPAQFQPASRERLIKEISHHGSQRTGQDEGGPEKRGPVDPRGCIGQCDQAQQRAENDSRAELAKRTIRDPVAKRRSRRLGQVIVSQ